jgi:hypothetical protein
MHYNTSHIIPIHLLVRLGKSCDRLFFFIVLDNSWFRSVAFEFRRLGGSTESAVQRFRRTLELNELNELNVYGQNLIGPFLLWQKLGTLRSPTIDSTATTVCCQWL